MHGHIRMLTHAWRAHTRTAAPRILRRGPRVARSTYIPPRGRPIALAG